MEQEKNEENAKIAAQEINKAIQSNSQKLDQSLLTFSTTALGVSATLLAKIKENPVSKDLLFSSWAFLFLAMCSTIAGFFFIDCSVRELWKCFLETPEKHQALGEKLSHRTFTINLISAIFLLIGVLFSLIFIGVNLYGS